jgi:pimeloyl-ACP methyl ester carboxylesterase
MTAIDFEMKPPRFPLMYLEGPRAVSELFSLALFNRRLANAPMGDGHPVIVSPGFLTGDRSTTALRKFLSDKGYHVRGWRLGRNFGLKTTGMDGELLAEQVINLYRDTRRKVTLIGWSLGGVLSREIAKQLPDQVRQVITLGSPIGGHSEATTIHDLYVRVTGHKPGMEETRELEEKLHIPPEFVPSTAIFSKTDGIVAWRNSIEPAAPMTDNIEVMGSHCGLGVNPLVFLALADRLAQPENGWVPFDRTTSLFNRLAYPFAGHFADMAEPV